MILYTGLTLVTLRQTSISYMNISVKQIAYTYRGSYMGAKLNVLLNLLNELPRILSLFLNQFNKFNNTRARM